MGAPARDYARLGLSVPRVEAMTDSMAYDPAALTDAEDLADERREDGGRCPYLEEGRECTSKVSTVQPIAFTVNVLCSTEHWRLCHLVQRSERVEGDNARR